MVVSQFLFFPIQMNLSENVLADENRLSRVMDPSGVGGYMRKRELSSIEINSARLSPNWSGVKPELVGLWPRNRSHKLGSAPKYP